MTKTLPEVRPFNIIAGLVPPGRRAYAVGGSVRDFLLGRPVTDVDVAVDAAPGAFASAVASSLGGKSFAMDEGRGVYRVVTKGEAPVQVDVTPLKGAIMDDLAARDFTVNAMAVRLAGPGAGGREGEDEVVDPFGGRGDLSAGLIRTLGRAAFTDDPLRLLRAFRIARQLGFAIDGGTLALISELAPAVRGVSAERVRDELFMILGESGAGGALREMAAAGLLREVIPETAPMEGLNQGEPHAHDLLEHSVRAAEYAEAVMADPGRYFGTRAAEASAFFEGELSGGPPMRALVKLAALLHDVGKPAVMKFDGKRVRFIGHDTEGSRMNAGIADRLRLSGRAKDALCLVAATHMRPLHMSFDTPSRRAVFRYVRDMGELLVAGLVVAIADAMATRERPGSPVTDVEGTAHDIAEYYYGDFLKTREEPLVTGRDLIDVFGLTPSPLFSEILEEVGIKASEKAITDREGALRFVRDYLAGLT